MHVSTKTITEYPWFIRLFFWNQKRRYGKVLEPGMLWGRSPWVFSTLALLYGALDRKRSPISPVLRSLITVRVSQINHCEFCVDINSATLLKRGIAEDKINALPMSASAANFAMEQEQIDAVFRVRAPGNRRIPNIGHIGTRVDHAGGPRFNTTGARGRRRRSVVRRSPSPRRRPIFALP